MFNSRINNLTKNWFIVTDANNIGKQNEFYNSVHNSAIPCEIPSVMQQYFPNYHGVCWYYCTFNAEILVNKTDRILLNFGGVDYKAEVWLNGKFIGEEEGGETPFTFDVTDTVYLDKENLLAVRVVNPVEYEIDGFTFMSVPHRNKEVEKRAGCNLNHGGMWHSVSLYSVPAVYLQDKLLHGKTNGDFTAEITVLSHYEIGGEVAVKIYENNGLGVLVAETTKYINFIKGKNYFTLNLTVPAVKLWDTENPNLYRVEIIVDTKYGKRLTANKFGFREFKVENGYFYLNGKKIFLKCAHTGNVFPVGQMVPVYVDQMRKDLIYAKASGFNTLRAISGMFRPEQIDLADEIGLLLYEECFASWCMGYSAVNKWRNSQEFIEMQKRHPVDVGTEEDMVKRWIHATTNMINRDKNATSIVAWGLLNETYESVISKTAIAYLPSLRAVDKSRLVILSSGRWELDFSVGSVSNPYSKVWENVWGNDGVLESVNNPHCDFVGDRHYYPVAPINEKSANHIRTMGYDTKYPVFFSEFGVGAQFNVIEEYKHFNQYGEREDLEDGAWLKLQSDQFTEDFYRLNLNEIYPFPESFLKDTQRINADERKRHFDMIRSNNRLCGYSLTGLFDHGMCGEGLWSYWRRWKPQMFDAISEGWANLRFCNFATINSYEGDEITLESVLANDGVLKSGTYVANFAITNDSSVFYTFSETFNLNENDFATPIFKRKIKLQLPKGKYYFTAELNEGSPVATTTHFYVYDKLNGSKLNTVYICGLTNEEKQKLSTLNINIADYNNQTDGVLLVGNGVNAEEILDKVKAGLTVIFLDWKLFDGENINPLKVISSDIKLTKHRDWLYHKDYVLADKTVFNGLGDKIVELARFVDVFAHTTINTQKTPNYVICPGFLTGFYGAKSGYELNYGLVGFDYGKGKVILNSFEILNNIGLPVADTLLVNLITKFNA